MEHCWHCESESGIWQCGSLRGHIPKRPARGIQSKTSSMRHRGRPPSRHVLVRAMLIVIAIYCEATVLQRSTQARPSYTGILGNARKWCCRENQRVDYIGQRNGGKSGTLLFCTNVREAFGTLMRRGHPRQAQKLAGFKRDRWGNPHQHWIHN